MKFILPKNILYIISIINNAGYRAHVVGGCVRDLILKRHPSDWDITTDALPEAIRDLFPKTFDTGLRHGTITVVYGNMPVEITTWRREEKYTDHRRPDVVKFTDSLSEDLSRRDFTVNAMAYHPDEGLIDPFFGLNDLNNRIIRCVGNPLSRFSEDALRMLRAIRFCAQLGFEIEGNTLDAVRKLSGDLSYISKERIQSEINKILESSNPRKLKLLWETGLFRSVFPDMASLSSVWIQIADKFWGHEQQKIILLALLFITNLPDKHITGAENILKSLKYDGATIRQVSDTLKSLEWLGPFTRRNLRKIASEYGIKPALNAIGIKKALLNPDLSGGRTSADISGEIPPITPIKPELSGLYIKKMGLVGRQIKSMLDILSLCLFEKPELNETDTLAILASLIMKSSVWNRTGAD